MPEEPVPQAEVNLQASAVPETAPIPSSPQQAVPSSPAVPSPAAADAAPPASPTWLEHLRSQGADFGPDEQTAMQNLIRLNQEAAQLRQMAPYVQQYMQSASQFAKWQEEQRKAQQPSGPQEDAPYWKPYWAPPAQYNTNWQKQLTVDAQGNIALRPGAPPQALADYQQWAEWQENQNRTFWDNPHQYMEPTIKHLAEEIADRKIQEHMARYSNMQNAQQFLQQNANFLMDIDPATGQPRQQYVWNPQTGQHQLMDMLSPWGQRYSAYVSMMVEQQKKHGYHDLDQIKQFASMAINNEILQARLQQFEGKGGGGAAAPGQAAAGAPAPAAAAENPREAANKRFTDQNNPAEKARRGGHRPNDKPEKITKLNLKRMMLADLEAKGL